MKIDRRSFMALMVGGAAGTALSPLPWKLTDDLSIWSQTWPWTPVPREGAVTTVNSVSTLCPGGCGISVRKVGDRAVKIEGMNGYPGNDGGICNLCLAGLQLLYGPTRIKTPLKRVGGRGQGRWQAISWDAAISEVGGQLGKLRSEGQPHKLACINGSEKGTVPQLFQRFLKTFGSPNFFSTPSMEDSYRLTLKMMQGVSADAGFDVENADFVLSFGSGIIDGWGASARMFKAKSLLRDKKGILIQIEPRLSNTAAKADQWIPVKPGTESTLALGMAFVIIKESLYHKEFVKKYSSGFDQFKQFVTANFETGLVARQTGVEKSVIIALARRFAQAANPLALCGKGQGTTPGSMGEFVAVHALNALVGNINREGGVWALPEPDYVQWPGSKMDKIARAGLQQGRIDGAGSREYPYARYLLDRLPEVINSGSDTALDILFVSGADPCYTMPSSQKVKAAFDKIPLIVSFSPWMNETAAQADIILPDHAHLERYLDVPTPPGAKTPMIGLSRPVVPPQFNTRHVGDVLILLANAVGGTLADAFPWDNYQACLEETMADKWAVLAEKGFWSEADYTPPTWKRSFATDSKKFEFVNQKISLTSLFAKIVPEGDEKSFPLTLIPYDSMRLANGAIGDPPFVIKTVSDTLLKGLDILVEINPSTAKSLGLAEGKYALLSTPEGQVKVKVHLFDGIMPDLIAMPRGLGHTAYDGYLANKGVNVNALIGPMADPVSGMNAAWGIRANLVKA